MTNILARAPLNQGQQAAADAFFQFLLDPEQKEMGISGPGGTGKTHLMGHMIDEILPRYFDTCKLMGIEPEYTEVDMTAMTNKAAEVLGTLAGRHVSTVHSLFNLKVQDDYSSGKSKITKTSAWRVHEGKVIFIDEASMEDTPLDQIVQEGTHNCKIVYVGDHCQMAPVMETISPIYRPGRMQWHNLTEQMRTQVPEIQALHLQLRETVETGVFKPIKIVPGVIDHLDDNQMQLMIGQTFAKQTMDSRILAFTNRRVKDYNDYIRQLRGLPLEYSSGEFLVNNSAIRLKGTMLSVEEEVEITNIGPAYDVTVDDTHEVVTMKVRNVDIKTRIGNEYKDIPLPIDRGHFADLIAYFKRQKMWKPYFELRNNYPDLRQRDAATVYKAQGSTYDSCFVDLGDISTCTRADQVARMLYVALSREKSRIFLYGKLADKYGGLTY